MSLPVAVLLVVMLSFVSCGAWSHVSCADIRSAYEVEIAEAQRCSDAPGSACSVSRPKALQDACRCQVLVNPARTTELDRLRAQFQARGCLSEPVACNRACVSL